MSIAAADILARVRTQLIDDGSTQRWSNTELLRWVTDGVRTIVAMSPSLGEQTAAFALAVGTKQTLPDGAFALLDIKRNLGEDGATPGRAVTVITRELMDAFDPDWHASRRASITKHYIYDPKQPRTFYCYPPSTGTGQVELSAAYTPIELATTEDTINLDELYQTALFDYVMFRAHQKDTDFAAGNDKAQVYLNLFQMFMSGHEAGKLAESPNQQLAPTDLANKGTAS